MGETTLPLRVSMVAALNSETARKNRDKSAKRMTPDQIAEAQRMAREWMARHQR